MAEPTDSIADVARAIQLALGPVFLLTGISGMLNVMTGRLARVIDRGRMLTEGPHAEAAELPEPLAKELEFLERRRHFSSVAIAACTIAALLICVVIAVLFIETMLAAPLSWVVALLFTGSTLSLVVGLTYFLREVHLAMQTIRITTRRARARTEPQS